MMQIYCVIGLVFNHNGKRQKPATDLAYDELMQYFSRPLSIEMKPVKISDFECSYLSYLSLLLMI